jgi:hypothetical protein
MNHDVIIIIGGAVILCLVIGLWAACRSSANRDKAWRNVIRRKDEDLQRAELFRKEAEYRWGELVETTGRRIAESEKGKE